MSHPHSRVTGLEGKQMVLNHAEQIVGGAVAVGVLLSDHLTGTAWYQQRNSDPQTTADYAEALREATAADMFAVQAERASFDAIEASETRVPLLTDDELDSLSADIDYAPAEGDELTPVDDDELAFVVPFADGLGLDWPADDDSADPFIWAGQEMNDSEVPF